MSAIYARYDDNILAAAAWTGTAPSTSYALATFGYQRPDWRVKFGSGTVTITATVTSARGDVIAIPVHNLGAAVLTLTNNNGLSVAIAAPTALKNGLPATLVVDFSGSASAGTRTATVWNLVIAGNPSNVTLGGLIAIYQKRTFGRDFMWSFHERETAGVVTQTNEYLTRFALDLESSVRAVDVVFNATAQDRLDHKDWFRAGHGSARPSLFWPDPTVADAYVGTWPDTFDVVRQVPNVNPVSLTFTELSKGIPIL